MNVALFVIRLVFGAIFIWSGIAKLKDPISFADAVRNFQIIGDPFAAATALFLPWLEVFAGIGVMWDRLARGSAAVLTASLTVFTLAIASAWARGLDISCGCFGGSGEINYPVKIVQNIVLITIGAFFWWREIQERTPVADSPETSRS